MAVDACIFAAVYAHENLAAEVRQRAERLRRFYAPLGLSELELVEPGPGLLAGRLGTAGPLVWGEADAAGMHASFSWSEGRVEIATSAVGPATLYEARADAVTAYATHAVAAAALAGLPLAVDRSAIGEFVAMDFVGGERTFIEGARTVAPASQIMLD